MLTKKRFTTWQKVARFRFLKMFYVCLRWPAVNEETQPLLTHYGNRHNCLGHRPENQCWARLVCLVRTAADGNLHHPFPAHRCSVLLSCGGGLCHWNLQVQNEHIRHKCSQVEIILDLMCLYNKKPHNTQWFREAKAWIGVESMWYTLIGSVNDIQIIGSILAMFRSYFSFLSIKHWKF